MYYPVKINFKNIRAIIKNTEWDFVPFKEEEQSVEMAVMGYFTPSRANWSYLVGISSRAGKVWLVVKVFGGVVGAVELYTGKDETKQAITSLTKELVAKAKPGTWVDPEDTDDLEWQGYISGVHDFEQNILKALEEV